MLASLADILKQERGGLGRHVLFLGSGLRLQPMRRTAGEALAEAARRWADEQSAWSELRDREDEAALLALFAERVAPAERCRMLRPFLAGAKPAEGHFRLARLVAEEYFDTIFTTGFDGVLERALESQHLLAGEDYIRAVVPGIAPDELRLALEQSSRIVLVKLGGDLEGRALPVTSSEWDDNLSPVADLVRQRSRALCILVGFSPRDRPVLDLIAPNGRPVYWASPQVPLGDRETFDELRLHSPEEVPHHEYWPEVAGLLEARHSAQNVIVRGEGEFDAFFAELYDRLIRRRRRSSRLQGKTDLMVLPGGPYRFLEPFDRKHADLFFGREVEVEQLKGLVAEHRHLVLFGRSGVGKTSLLRAGLMPTLVGEDDGDDSERFLPVYCRALVDPVAELKQAIVNALDERDLILSETSPEASLVDPIRVASEASPVPLVILLDQFEELHVRLGGAARESFLDALADAMEGAPPTVRFVLAIREDFLGQLYDLAGRVPDLYHHLYRLTCLGREDADAAIVKPASQFDIRVDAELAEAIIEDLYLDGVLPGELQIVCDRVYGTLRRHQRLMALKHYEQLGRAEKIIGGLVDDTLGQLAWRDRSLARAVLKELVTGHETRAIGSVERLAAAAGTDEAQVERLLAGLEDLRLVRHATTPDGRYYELVHEYIASQVTGWLSQSESRTRDVQELLGRELNNWRKFGLLMHEDKLPLIHERREALRMSRDELALVMRSAAAADFEVEYWFGRIEELRDRAYELLDDLLADPAAGTRRHAVDALARLEGPPALQRLARALEDGDTNVRAAARGHLERRERELVESLRHDDGATRRVAAQGLGQLDGRRARAELMAALDDPDPGVRGAVAEALQQMPSPDATSELLRRFDRREPPSWSVAEVLGRSGDQREILDTLARRAPRAVDSAQAHYVLGRTYMVALRPELAERELAAAAQLAQDAEGRSLVAAAQRELDATRHAAADRGLTWGMFRRDAARSGCDPAAFGLPIEERWRFRTGDFVASSPAVADGLAYCGARDGNLYCLDAETGVLRWRYTTGGRVESSPCVHGSRVFVGSHDGSVYAFDARSGRRLWERRLGGPVRSSCNATGELVLVASWDGVLRALQAEDGADIWSFAVGSEIYASPAVGDGRVALGTWDANCYALELDTGREIWRYATEGEISSSTALAGGLVVYGSDDGHVYALKEDTGDLVWRRETGGRVRCSPAVDGTAAYVGSQDGLLRCLHVEDGRELWRATTHEEIVSSPAVAGDWVLFASRDGALYAAATADGEIAWSAKTPYGIVSSPAVSQGRVYIGMDYYHICAFGKAQR